MSAALTGLDRIPPEAREHLAAFKRELEEALPGRVARVTLFGSRARGDAEEDSDYDVAVFVRDQAEDWRLTSFVSEIAYPYVLEGTFISPIVLPTEYLAPDPPTELAADIARDGLVLP